MRIIIRNFRSFGDRVQRSRRESLWFDWRFIDRCLLVCFGWDDYIRSDSRFQRTKRVRGGHIFKNFLHRTIVNWLKKVWKRKKLNQIGRSYVILFIFFSPEWPEFYDLDYIRFEHGVVQISILKIKIYTQLGDYTPVFGNRMSFPFWSRPDLVSCFLFNPNQVFLFNFFF